MAVIRNHYLQTTYNQAVTKSTTKKSRTNDQFGFKCKM